MDQDASVDYYDVLQVSTTAEPDTIHRVYRLLAQRFHPDNKETGNPSRFREIAEAYAVLGDPEKRARYDVVHERLQKERWRLVETGTQADHDFLLEQRVRLTVLEVLYTKRRADPTADGLSILDLEKFTGRAREQLEFTMWYLGAAEIRAALRQLAVRHHRRRPRSPREELRGASADASSAGGEFLRVNQ